jgi:hypothetical protein
LHFAVEWARIFKLPAPVEKGAAGFGWTGDVHAYLSNYVLLVLSLCTSL